MPGIATLPFFDTVKTASKNEKSKHGNKKLVNKFIDIVLLDMSRWITK
jgi:hypothetical protein